MSKTTSTRVLITIDDRSNATLTLNRPDVHNALDPEMVRASPSVARDKAVRAVVIAGAGFCAAPDIAHMRQSAHFTKKQNFNSAANRHLFPRALLAEETHSRRGARRRARRWLRHRRGLRHRNCDALGLSEVKMSKQ